MTQRTSPLSKEFVVACEIYHGNLQNKKVTYKFLSKFMEDTELKEHIKFLLNWGIIEAKYDSELNEKTLQISLISKENIKEIYNMWYITL